MNVERAILELYWSGLVYAGYNKAAMGYSELVCHRADYEEKNVQVYLGDEKMEPYQPVLCNSKQIAVWADRYL